MAGNFGFEVLSDSATLAQVQVDRCAQITISILKFAREARSTIRGSNPAKGWHDSTPAKEGGIKP